MSEVGEANRIFGIFVLCICIHTTLFRRVKLPYVTSMYLAYDQRDYAISMQLYIIETFIWPDQLY